MFNGDINSTLLAVTSIKFVYIFTIHYNFRYDHPHILAGQGTMGLEIVEQVPDVDAVLVPVGGAGLLAGTALAIKSLKPNVLVYVSNSNNLVGALEPNLRKILR